TGSAACPRYFVRRAYNFEDGDDVAIVPVDHRKIALVYLIIQERRQDFRLGYRGGHTDDWQQSRAFHSRTLSQANIRNNHFSARIIFLRNVNALLDADKVARPQLP